MRLGHRVTTTVGVTCALMLTAGPAFAHDCTNSSKQVGAGSVAHGYFTTYVDADGTILGEDEEYVGMRLNPQGRPEGGWFTIHLLVSIDGAEPFEFAVHDVLIRNDLPEPPRLGGPGDDLCDGVGIDDAATCFDAAVAELMATL